jgi:tRNA U34 2-thiouridine synthase MnmA/TrmU
LISSAELSSQAQYIPPRPGPIIDLETGLQVGEYTGPWNFTIGQGAKVRGLEEKTFVAKKDIPKNIMYVVSGTSVLSFPLSNPYHYWLSGIIQRYTQTIRDWTWTQYKDLDD